MSDNEPKAGKTIPKGGRKGGTLFPKINLQQAIVYAKKLVAKTHTGAQPEKTILPGVFGNSGPGGKVRASALKQYNLLDGSVAAYKATQLAKSVDAALPADLPPLLQQAFLRPKVFKQIFDTFHGDTVSKAKIEQLAKGLNVHPESAEECAQLFIDSAVTAKLGTLNGDALTLEKAGTIVPAGEAPLDEEPTELAESEEGIDTENADSDGAKADGKGEPLEREAGSSRAPQKPAITLSLTVDPTSDPDKLEKQLKLLRQYGVI